MGQAPGLDGARIDDPGQIDPVLDRAFAANRPFVIDAVVDAAVPLIPPHLVGEQVLKTAKAEFSGDPAFFAILEEGIRETVVSAVRARFTD